MKYVVVLGDGMADEPLEQLDNKTPLEYADTPIMDELSVVSEIGLSKTIPEMNVFMLGMPIKIFVGLIIITITLSGAPTIAEGLTVIMEEKILVFFNAMSS